MPYFAIISKWWTQTFRRVSTLPFIFILIGIELYFFVNGKAHFPNWDSTYGNLIMIYLIMTILFLAWARGYTKAQLNRPLKDSAIGFVLFFILTYVILFALSFAGTFTIDPLSKDLFWQTIFIQVCVVATSEELMFRGVLLEHTGIFISSVLFALWHSYAYQIKWYDLSIENINLLPVIFAFVMGVVLAYIARSKWGLAGSIGVHACYNLFLAGAFVTAGSLM